MGFAELFILAVGLSMDAFAVAVCKGLSLRRAGWKEAGIVGLYFGIFQAGMPLIGYFLGIQFEGFIKEYDHWISFILLSFIGVSMLWEALHKEKASGTPDKTDKKNTDSLGFRVMLLLALATSIDALTVGVTFAFLQVNIIWAVALIGVTTLLLSMAGVKIGNVFGAKYKAPAEAAGGIILILLGVKILLEHLEIIHF